jgi:YhcH/YjgK/YiaL family protein
MIKDKIENLGIYTINDSFEVFKKFVAENLNTDEILKIQLPYKAIPLEYKTADHNLSEFESHRKYIDIHYILEGTEEIGITQIGDVTPNMDFDVDSDYQLFDGQVQERITLSKGEFLILFPHETHVTAGTVDAPGKIVKKIVFKSLVNDDK